MFWNILCLAWYVYSVQCIKLYSFLLLNRTHAQIAPIRLTAKYVYLNSDMTECVVIYFWWKCRLLSSYFGFWKFNSIDFCEQNNRFLLNCFYPSKCNIMLSNVSVIWPQCCRPLLVIWTMEKTFCYTKNICT